MAGKNLESLLDSVSSAAESDSQKTAAIDKLSEEELVDRLDEEFKGQEVDKLAGALENIADLDAELEAVRPLQKVAELASVAEILESEGVTDDGVDENGPGPA